ncbi:hypothetical protein RUND412_000435 [Rhizina undulata]
MHRQRRSHIWEELHRRDYIGGPTGIDFDDVPTLTLHVRQDTSSSTTYAANPVCTNGDTSVRCEKPTSSSTTTLPIILGAAIPITVAIVVLLFLHRRATQRMLREDVMDKTKSMDFGMGLGPAHAAKGDSVEKNSNSSSRRQLSMDINVASPYLLPDALHSSRDSFTSLARTVHSGDDRYGRPMTANSTNSPHRNNSQWGRRTRDSYEVNSPDGSQISMGAGLLSDAQRMPTSTPPPPRSIMPQEQYQKPAAPKIQIPSPTSKGPHPNGLPASPRANLPLMSLPSPTKDNQPTAGVTPVVTVGSVSAVSPQHQSVYVTPEIMEPPHSPSARPNSNGNIPFIELPEEPQTPPPGPRMSLLPGAQNTNRLSMGFRPLPPQGNPDDTAEERAMRIRSFYKEYFEENKDGAGVPPVPALPGAGEYNMPQEHMTHQDDSAPVFDAETGRFVIPGARPFAEAPTRRAMTPPPRMPPRFGGDSRTTSAASGRFMPPGGRSFTSASNHPGARPPPRRPMQPPKPLNLLPTPHMLAEDTFSSPTMFAPVPRVFRADGEGNTGRGGLRPYSPTVPAHVPLVSSFSDLSALPTPAMLRKSGTFTSLDFAPPRKFKNDDGMGSDAGSIHSNRSGVSAAQVQNIRNGAYRVSRLPQDVVPLKDSMAENLKPTWDMRGPAQ